MKRTTESEFNELAKHSYGVCALSNLGGFAIVISRDGSNVLWRENWNGHAHTAQRWQQIKYTNPRNGESRAYITIYGRRYYIDDFMRA